MEDKEPNVVNVDQARLIEHLDGDHWGGYSEPSTFYRAFRRWTGTSPREFRNAASA